MKIHNKLMLSKIQWKFTTIKLSSDTKNLNAKTDHSKKQFESGKSRQIHNKKSQQKNKSYEHEIALKNGNI